jgi:folate-binding protein YgfZ
MKMFYYLQSRGLIHVTGPDAAEFLQNTLTNDVRKLDAGNSLQYALLLSPQGQILHELFILWQGENDYLLDIHLPRKPDLTRRLTLFKLRAKVTMTDLAEAQAGVFARLPDAVGEIDTHHRLIADPRRAELGQRLYVTDGNFPRAAEEHIYTDYCIDEGVVTGDAIRYERDFVHDLGLEKLNAISWDKGCFIGQEVAARVEHRGLAKKAVFTVKGEGLDPAQPIQTTDGLDAGELRLISRDGRRGLAILKKMVLETGKPLQNGTATVILP